MTLDELLVIKDRTNLAVVCFSLLWVVYLTIRGRRSPQGPSVLLIVFLFLAVGVGLEIRAVYEWANNFFGQANAAWLVIWLTRIVLNVSVLYVLYRLENRRLPQWFVVFSLLTLVYILHDFILGSLVQASYDSLFLPANGAEFFFFAYYYAHSLIVSLLGLRLLVQGFAADKAVLVRFRYGMVYLLGVSVSVFFVSRLAFAFWNWLRPINASFRFDALLLPHIFMHLAILLLPIAFLPYRWLVALSQKATNLSHITLVKDLEVVQQALARYCPPIITWEPAGWLDIVRRSDLHLYRLIIDILDRKHMLAGYLAHPVQQGQMRAVLEIVGFWVYDPARRLEAAHLLECLQTIDDNQAFGDLVQQYRQVGQVLRQPMPAFLKDIKEAPLPVLQATERLPDDAPWWARIG